MSIRIGKHNGIEREGEREGKGEARQIFLSRTYSLYDHPLNAV
jgi:hypothetical protein